MAWSAVFSFPNQATQMKEYLVSYEMTCGLLVVDGAIYSQYRAEIAPLLRAVSGAFRFDFEIARTLKSEVDHEINRLFLLRFPDREAKERFFANPQYVAVRSRLFERAVLGMTILSEHEF